jgi:hypothetical protein
MMEPKDMIDRVMLGEDAMDVVNEQCPGSKIRSKGKGRGLGKGRGKGPMGVPVGESVYTGGGKMASSDWFEARGGNSGVWSVAGVAKVVKRQLSDEDHEAAAELISRLVPYDPASRPEPKEMLDKRTEGWLMVAKEELDRNYPDIAKAWNKVAKKNGAKRLPNKFDAKKLKSLADDPWQ